MKKIDINEVVNMNGKTTICKINGTRFRFSFRAAKMHFTVGLSRNIDMLEGRYLAKNETKCLKGIAQERHNAITDNERQNKAFLLCRTALQKGKLPKGYKEKDIKEVCFSSLFIEELRKCECKTGYNTDRLLLALSRELAIRNKSAKKNNKK